MTTDEQRIELDANVLEQLASLICGDDHAKYRDGRELTKFFKNLGWPRVGEVEPPRRVWVLDMLTRRNLDDGAMRRVILRLADRREYINDETSREQTVEELNGLLAIEGYRVAYENGRPILEERTDAADSPQGERLTKDELLRPNVSIAEIVDDRELGEQLQSRLDEAAACLGAGAYTAAVVMLGGLVEGLLYHFACRHSGGRPVRDNLSQLLNLARDEKWIKRDVFDYGDVLRDHRNLIHPRKQHKDGHAPNGDTVRIGWNIVVAVINDLAVCQNRAAASPQPSS